MYVCIYVSMYACVYIYIYIILVLFMYYALTLSGNLDFSESTVVKEIACRLPFLTAMN